MIQASAEPGCQNRIGTGRKSTLAHSHVHQMNDVRSRALLSVVCETTWRQADSSTSRSAVRLISPPSYPENADVRAWGGRLVQPGAEAPGDLAGRDRRSWQIPPRVGLRLHVDEGQALSARVHRLLDFIERARAHDVRVPAGRGHGAEVRRVRNGRLSPRGL